MRRHTSSNISPEILQEEKVMLLNIKKIGDSLSITIPKAMADSMKINDGDRLFATKISSGYEISAYEPIFEKKINAARRGMKKYNNALMELAE